MKDGKVETKMFIRSRAGANTSRKRRSADESRLFDVIKAVAGADIEIGSPVLSTDILGPDGNVIGSCSYSNNLTMIFFIFYTYIFYKLITAPVKKFI